jgi:DNA helicase HerA-like ATPase
MPNYNTGLYNNIVDHAEELHDFLSGNYMNAFENRLLDCGAAVIKLGPMQFTRIIQYRRTEDVRSDLKTIQAAMAVALSYCARNDAAFGFFLVSNGGEYAIYLAVEELPVEGVTRSMTGMIPDLSFQAGFIPTADVRRLSSHAGIVSGNLHCNGQIADMLLQALSGVNGIIGILAVPMNASEITSYVDSIDSIHQRMTTLLNHDMTYTSRVRKINQRNYRFIPELDAQLEHMSEYYRNANEDYWKTCLWFSCENKQALPVVGNAIAGALNGVNDSADKARVFFTTSSPFYQGRFYLPAALFGARQFAYEDALMKPSLVAYTSTSHLSSLLQFPTSQVPGFDVIELTKTGSSLHLFDVAHQSKPGGIVLGKIENGTDYTVSLSDLTEHVLITGATGSGKTTTVFNLVCGIHASGVPMLIIEPSKKDYWLLGSELRDMRVFSFGQDAELLRINPLMPEEGVIIGNHIDSLLYAFSGAFEMEEPTRLALDGLLKAAYEQFGWRTSDIAFHSEKPFPQIKDLLVLLPDYCRTSLPYGNEVQNNIYGSLVNRLSSLNSGMFGESVNAAHSITGKELCAGTVLVELDDLSLETKPFVAMLLMIKVDQYLRQGDTANQLKNAIILEEAHNIFANVSSDRHNDPRDKASRFFSNMLSQIRGYGAGIIIADQGPSQINDMAISNTKVKIIHSIVNGEDIDKIAFALNLTDIQKRAFPSLPTGDAIVALRGSRNVNRVKINHFSIDPIRNIACLFCDRKKSCDSFNVISGQPLFRTPLYVQGIMKNRLNRTALKSELRSIASFVGYPQEQELCLLGRLLSNTDTGCGEREKRRIIQRYLQ